MTHKGWYAIKSNQPTNQPTNQPYLVPLYETVQPFIDK